MDATAKDSNAPSQTSAEQPLLPQPPLTGLTVQAATLGPTGKAPKAARKSRARPLILRGGLDRTTLDRICGALEGKAPYSQERVNAAIEASGVPAELKNLKRIRGIVNERARELRPSQIDPLSNEILQKMVTFFPGSNPSLSAVSEQLREMGVKASIRTCRQVREKLLMLIPVTTLELSYSAELVLRRLSAALAIPHDELIVSVFYQFIKDALAKGTIQFDSELKKPAYREMLLADATTLIALQRGDAKVVRTRRRKR